MVVYGFDLKGMKVIKLDYYLEKTKRGAIIWVEDDKITYLPKDCLNSYAPFSIGGEYVVVFDKEYSLDKIHNSFLGEIIKKKERDIEKEIVSHRNIVDRINEKIEYFKSNLK